MLDKLQLTKNAQFYTHENKATDATINTIIEAALDNINPEHQEISRILREERTTANGFKYNLSLIIFPSMRPVYFIKNEEKLVDLIHAFLLLIETDSHLVVLKKSCAPISEAIEKNFSLIRSTELIGTFNDDDVEFQKIALRNMTVAETAMRSRSYEAADLKGLLSTHAAGRSIPFYFKFRQGALVKTISATGRLVETAQRDSIDEIADWANTQIHLIENPINQNSFTDSFAKKIELSEVMRSCRPSAILVESNTLQEDIEKQSLVLTYETRRGKKIEVSSRAKQQLFYELEKVFEIDTNLKIDTNKDNATLKKNNKTLTFNSKSLAKYKIMQKGKEITLQKYIIKNSLYSIAFTNPEYMYFMGSCFQDTSALSGVKSIIEILHPKTELSNCSSEKGAFDNQAKAFSNGSVFNAVESIHNNDDYIFCDDLGLEWADHITLNKSESCITFIHSKHGEESTSASNLHDVVGQAIKNLGYMHFTKNQFLKKSKSFRGQYRTKNTTTQITKTRKGNLKSVSPYLEELLKDYRLHRKCILACSFISKKEIKKQFSKLQKNQPVRGHIIQLLWILSSFAHAAKDMYAIPIIYCKA